MNGGMIKAAGHGAIAALAGLLLSTGSARAADLGGNCCVDLEERVAELEATTVRKGNRKVSLTLSGQVNRSVMYWNDGFDKDIYSVDNGIGNSRFRLLGTARINPQLTAGFYIEMDLTIGARSHQVNQIDDDGFTGSGGILGGAANGDGIGGAGDSVLGWNQANWYLDHKHWGRLTVGRMSTTTAGIGIIDLSNTGVMANAQPFLWGGTMILRNGIGALSGAPTNGVGSDTWGQMCGGPSNAGPYGTDCGIHALSRRDAVMYSSPTWQGFSAGVSWGENDFWDASLRYAGEHHGFRVAAGVGYRNMQDREPDVLESHSEALADTDRRHTLASASAMHVATGLFLSGSWTRYEFRGSNVGETVGAVFDGPNRPDVTLWWLGGGIQRNWTGLGNTTFYGEYGKVDDGINGTLAATSLTALGPGALGAFTAGTTVLSSEMTWWGLGAVQTIDAAAMDLYLGYRRYSADATVSGGLANQIPGGLEDIWYVQAGARIQF